jgi:hypothetical protein
MVLVWERPRDTDDENAKNKHACFEAYMRQSPKGRLWLTFPILWNPGEEVDRVCGSLLDFCVLCIFLA